jgi:hypothetical protein
MPLGAKSIIVAEGWVPQVAHRLGEIDPIVDNTFSGARQKRSAGRSKKELSAVEIKTKNCLSRDRGDCHPAFDDRAALFQ